MFHPRLPSIDRQVWATFASRYYALLGALAALFRLWSASVGLERMLNFSQRRVEGGDGTHPGYKDARGVRTELHLHNE